MPTKPASLDTQKYNDVGTLSIGSPPQESRALCNPSKNPCISINIAIEYLNWLELDK
jgi:hypothetical protein